MLVLSRKANESTVIDDDIKVTRHPEFRGREFHMIRGKTTVVDDEDCIKTDLVRVTTDFAPELEDYDPAEDVDLYEEFLPEKLDSPSPLSRKIWVERCEAAEWIEVDYGTEKALGYLIGEKLLNFLEVAERKPEWRAEKACKESVKYLDLTIESLLTRVVLPESDVSKIIQALKTQLGIESEKDRIAEYL